MIQRSAPSVDAAIRSSFESDGIALLPGLLNDYWLGLLSEAAEDIRSHVKGGRDGVVHEDNVVSENAWTFNAKLKSFAFESAVAQVATEVMNSKEVRLFETLTIYKEQGCSQLTGWHQDMNQHGKVDRQACSVWLSLDPVDESTGALRAAAGFHLGPWYTPPPMPPDRAGDRVELEGGPTPDPDADRQEFSNIVSYSPRAGDVILLHPSALHSTRANPSRERRRSFSNRLFGDDIRRKSSPVEWHSWLKDLPLKDGDPLRSDRFPLLYP